MTALSKSASKARWGLRLAVGILATALVLYLAGHRFDFRSAWIQVGRADRLDLALCLAASLTTIALKTMRWRWLYYPDCGRLSWGRLVAALMIGQLGNTLLPARLGDLARIVAVSAEGGVGTGLTMVTVVVEKAIDGLMLLALLAALLPLVALAPWLKLSQLALSAALVVLLIVLTLLAARQSLRKRLLDLLRRLPLGRLMGYLERASEALGRLRALHEPGVQARLWGLSILTWLLYGLSNYWGFCAVGLRLPLSAGLLLTVAEFAGTQVAYTPAGIGVYHSICILTLSLFAVPFEPALGAAILLHLVVYLPILALGLVSLWCVSLDLRTLRG